MESLERLQAFLGPIPCEIKHDDPSKYYGPIESLGYGAQAAISKVKRLSDGVEFALKLYD